MATKTSMLYLFLHTLLTTSLHRGICEKDVTYTFTESHTRCGVVQGT